MEIIFTFIIINAVSLIVSVIADLRGDLLVAQLAIGFCLALEFITLICLIINAVSKIVGGA